MPRVDIWDVGSKDEEEVPLSCGFPRASLEDKYELGRELGQGGFGSVRVVTDVASGAQYACKSIKKALEAPGVNPETLQRHLDNIKREAAILRRLRGTVRWQRRELSSALRTLTHSYLHAPCSASII
eukprot:360908-Chlamydomonas_euryale.AAC.20